MEADILTLRKNPLEYTNDQKNALEAAASFLRDPERHSFVLAGYAGTGKTTLLENIAGYIRKLKCECLLTAPTNRAVRVLADKIPAHPGRTLHSMLYDAPDEQGNWIPHVEFEQNQVVVCDEASMVGQQVHADLMNRIMAAKAKLIYTGDSFQLPPVGNDPKILRAPDFTLKQVMRQAAESNILSLATVVRTLGRKVLPDSSEPDVALSTPRAVLTSFLMDIQKGRDCVFICGKNETRIEINRKARAAKFGVNFGSAPRPGDRLLCIENGPNVNGETLTADHIAWCEGVTIGIRSGAGGSAGDYPAIQKIPAFMAGLNHAKYLIIPEIAMPSVYHGQVVVDRKIFGGDWSIENKRANRWELNKSTVNIATYAYAITAHKSQGGQWGKVYVNQEASWDEARWFYTAITRATDELVIARDKTASCKEMTWQEIRFSLSGAQK